MPPSTPPPVPRGADAAALRSAAWSPEQGAGRCCAPGRPPGHPGAARAGRAHAGGPRGDSGHFDLGPVCLIKFISRGRDARARGIKAAAAAAAAQSCGRTGDSGSAGGARSPGRSRAGAASSGHPRPLAPGRPCAPRAPAPPPPATASASAMPAPGAPGAARLLLALLAAALCGPPRKEASAASNSPYPCAEDEECSPEEYCASPGRAGGAGGTGAPVCLACRKRRKRCMRHAMCCPGNYCKNGICMPSDHGHFHRGEIEETILESGGNDHSTLDGYPRRTTLSSKLYHTKGQEGSVCLRSSDCATGLCCARHFWSKICKPVLKEGQVCTKHRRKGSHGLEIFQRCYCGEGLSCRLQKDHHQASNSSRLHTCQRH
eukprot:XP_005636721.2 dickkopf-related protein 1 [Canis lupus familiaris]